ncbi:MAG: hypothetical protein NTX07_05315 [Solirubrobacterales bacterium]|nr:hypothetical protein [Solirubrobacterales bacterium]
MTPPATAAARMRPASYAAQRASHVAPISAVPEVSVPSVSSSPERIRKGRPGSGRTLPRPNVRRYSGSVEHSASTQGSGIAEAAMDFRRDLSAVEMPRLTMPKVKLSSLRPRMPHLHVPNPKEVVGAVRSAPDHSVTRFMTSTRVWVGVLAVLIGGLVFMQVQILQVNAGIGENVQKISSLERKNAELRTAVSGLGSDQRIVSEAQRMGFVEPPVGSSHFTAAHSGDAMRALALLTPSSSGTGMVSSDAATSSDSNSPALPSDTSSSDGSGGSGSSGGTYASGTSSTPPSTSSSTDSGTTSTTAAAPDGGSSPLSG